jgi:hypothetical protein
MYPPESVSPRLCRLPGHTPPDMQHFTYAEWGVVLDMLKKGLYRPYIPLQITSVSEEASK